MRIESEALDFGYGGEVSGREVAKNLDGIVFLFFFSYPLHLRRQLLVLLKDE